MCSSVFGPRSVAAPLLGGQHVVGLFQVGDDLIERLFLCGTHVVFLHLAVDGLCLQDNAAILGEQPVVVVSAEEVSFAHCLVAAVLVLHVRGFVNDQVGG